MGDPIAPEPEKRPVGRPSEYDEAYCHRVVVLGKEGKSRAEIASDLDCSRMTLAAWERQHPEFLYALQRAKDEELAWWEAQARKGLTMGSGFNAAIWSKSVSGRFPSEPYRERVQLTGAQDGPVRHQHAIDLSKVSDDDLSALERVLGTSALVDGDQGGEGEASDRS